MSTSSMTTIRRAEEIALASTIPVKSPATKTVYYRWILRQDLEKSSAALATELARYSSMDAATILGTFRLLGSYLPQLVREHPACFWRIDGLGTIYGSIEGSSDTPDAAFSKERNQVVVRIRLESALRDAMKDLTVRNLTAGADSMVVQTHMDGSSVDDVIVGKGIFVISGRDLILHADATDEGVWLLDKATGATAATFALDTNDVSQLRVHLDVVPAVGAYTLRIATRGGLPVATTMPVTINRTVELQA